MVLEIYQSINPGSDLGNSVNSIGFNGEFAYIVSSGSSRITVVNRFTFEEQARITVGLDNPRHFVVIGDRGYVSNWGDDADLEDDFIAVIDLNQNLVIDNIPVEEFPGKLLVSGTDLIVAHQGNILQAANNFISIIDTTTNIPNAMELEARPNSMDLDGQGNLLILTDPILDDNGVVVTNASFRTLDLESTDLGDPTDNFQPTQNPSSLVVANGFAYYIQANTVSRVSIGNVEQNPDSIVTGFTYSNINVIGDLTLAIDGPGGSVSAFTNDPASPTSTPLGTQEVGEFPNNIYMN